MNRRQFLKWGGSAAVCAIVPAFSNKAKAPLFPTIMQAERTYGSVGYKGKVTYDAGVVYAPYIPLQA